jgi:serine protease AprX
MRSLFVFALLIFSLAIIGQKKIDQALFQNNTTNQLDYLVFLHQQPELNTKHIKGKNNKATFVYNTLTQAATNSQQELIAFLNQNNLYYEPFKIVNAIRVKSDFVKMQAIAQRAEVQKVLKNINISLDQPNVSESEPQTRTATPEWGILKIEADSVWRMGFEGQGVIVGGQDTGYDWKVAPLQSKYRGYVNDSIANHNYNWHDAIKDKSPLSADSLNPCGFNIKEPCDDNNHGTHTMGTMVGQDTANSIGVAPAATWMACRNMERGNGQLSTYLECFEWFLAPTDLDGKNADVTKAPHVINNSWYCSEGEGCNLDNWLPLQVAVQNLKASGVVVVVSAGNSGPNCFTISGPPALFEPSFSVGATAINDTIANFSSRGTVSIDSSFRMKPDVSAPGRNVRSVIRGGGFANFSGTSMAGPHVAGLVALILSANKSLAGEVEQIEEIIRKSSIPKYSDQECGGISGQAIPNPVYGFGRINALKAVQMAINLTSIDDPSLANENAWQVYPNPTSGLITIQEKLITTQASKVALMDINGHVIISQIFQNLGSISLGDLPNGVYVMQITSHNKVQIEKVIKQ